MLRGCIYYVDKNICGAWVIYGDLGVRQYYGYTKRQSIERYQNDWCLFEFSCNLVKISIVGFNEVFLPNQCSILIRSDCIPSPCERFSRIRFYGFPCQFRVLRLLWMLRCHAGFSVSDT